MRPRPDAGKILSQTFSVFFGNLPAFSAIILIVLLPYLVLMTWQTLGEMTDPTTVDAVLAVVLIVLSFVLTPIATGALTYGVFQAIRDRKPGVGECLSVGLKRMLPVLGVSLVVGILTALGYLACIVPGLILMTMWVAAVPAAVIENAGVGEALKRSSELTKGYRWLVFGVIFVIGLIGVLLGFGVSFVTVAVMGDSLWLVVILQAVVTLFSQGLQATYPALVYYHLRTAKETIDLDEIAAVFD